MTGRRRDIARLALQSALAGALAWLAVRWTGTGEAFLAVISAVLVLEPARAQTLKSAGDRVVGTLIGTAIGLIALLGTSSVPTPVSLAAVMLVMGGLVAWKPDWRYGVVAAAGLAVASDGALMAAAQTRGIAIFLGAGVGIAVGALVWPESAGARARRQISAALEACRDLLDATLSATLAAEPEVRDGLHGRFRTRIQQASETARSIRLGRGRIARCYGEAVHSVERLWHALIILDRAREAKSGDALPVRDRTLENIRAIQSRTCAALGHAIAFERTPPGTLAALAAACRDVWAEARIDPDREDELQGVGLVFGLSEVGRNLREIDEAIGVLGAAR